MNRNTAASQTTVNSSRASTPIRLQNSSNLSIILASSDPCLFYGSWLVTWAREASMLYPVKLQEKLNSLRSEENKPGQSQWVLAWIVMYLWHSHAGLLLLPLQVLQKHISSLSSLTTFQEFLAWRSMFLAPLCRLHPVTLKSSTDQLISR